MLSAAGRLSGVTKPAKEFTVDEIVQVFRLNYTEMPFNMEQYIWRIEDSELDFMMTPYFTLVLENYAKNFDRSSEAICRTALDLILNECLTVLKGNHHDVNLPTAETTGDHQKKSPGRFDDLRVYGELAFDHKVLSQSETPSTSPRRLSISGHLDYGIGRVIYRWPERHFQCALVIVTAKVQSCASLAVPELLAYLACLRQSRVKRNRTDASVYGIASDGYQYVFVTITHDGTVKTSGVFDIFNGNLLKVLGWLKFILEKTAAMGGDENDGEDLDDPPIDLYDNDYTNPPEDSEEED